MVHGNYVPLSPRKQRGYFDIVVKRDTGDSFDDGLGSTRSDMEFSRYLDKLPIGERAKQFEREAGRTNHQARTVFDVHANLSPQLMSHKIEPSEL